jgi:toxin CcdB
MARFDVHRNIRGRLLLNVQADILPELGTRVVVPLLHPNLLPAPLKRLHPVVRVDGEELILATHLMAAVPLRSLGRPLESLDSQYDTIKAAIDMAFNGF